MKYILKKDFLFAKAGKEVRIFYGASQSSILFNTDISTIDLHISSSAEIYLLKEGWIEEVKLKEFYIIIHKDDNITMEDKIPERCELHNCRIIKVREIVE